MNRADVNEASIMRDAGKERHDWPYNHGISACIQQSAEEANLKEERGGKDKRGSANTSRDPHDPQRSQSGRDESETPCFDGACHEATHLPKPVASDHNACSRVDTVDDHEDMELISTLREGLHLPACEPSKAESSDPPSFQAAAGPKFLTPDGQIVDLPVGEQDSLSYRIEALKVYLEHEIGLDDFLFAYRFLNETVQCEAAAPIGAQGSAPPELHLESNVSAKAIRFLPLLHQLIVCEDKCFGN